MPGLVALALAYVLSQFYRSFLAVLTPQLTTELGADKAELSQASGLWFLAFGLMQFVVGVGLDRYGPRRTAGWIFGVAATCGALVFATAQTPTAITVAMCLFGIGCSPVLMASLFIYAQRFDVRQFAIMTSWLVAFGNLGNVVGASPLATAVDLFGWRDVMLALGALSLMIGLATLRLVHDPVVEQPAGAGFGGYITLLKSPGLWAIMVMMLFCYAPVAGIRGLWVGPYLTDLYAANSRTIGRITLWMAMAMVAGSLIYGPLDRIFNTRKWVVFTGNALVLGVLLFFTFEPTPALNTATGLFVVMGVCGTSYGVLMAHGRSFIPAHLVGRGVTLFNFYSIAGVGLMQFVTGRVVAAQADPASPTTYQHLFGSYAAVVLAALLIYLTSRDSAPTGR